MEIPAAAIVKLGTDLNAAEELSLRTFIQNAAEVFATEFDAMSNSEAEFFGVIMQLTKRAWDNHAAGKTEADLPELLNDLMGPNFGNTPAYGTDPYQIAGEAIAKSGNRELQVYFKLVDMMDKKRLH